jgi:hypothetical protein
MTNMKLKFDLLLNLIIYLIDLSIRQTLVMLEMV